MGIVPANQPALYQTDISNCQCQPRYLYDTCGNCEFLNPIDVLSPGMPIVIIEAPRSVVKMPSCAKCQCQMPVECCQRQKCGCQLRASDVPCSCQMPTSCGCTLSSLDMPFVCQLPPLNLPCGCQLPGLDCGCQFQAFNTPCSCQMGSGSCQLPVPNVPYAYQLLDVPYGYDLPVLDACGCQLPSCSCQMSPPSVGCGKYLRKITLPPPFL